MTEYAFAHCTTDFISFDPSPDCEELILDYKAQVRQLAGNQVYLDEPPHMTVYLSSFDRSVDLDSEISTLARHLRFFTVKIVGWHIFENDPVAGNNTLVCEFDEDSKQRLRDRQSIVVRKLAVRRHVEASNDRYAQRAAAFTDAQEDAVKQYGFPFLGPGWHPHFTIASVRQADWSIVEQSLAGQPPSIYFTCRQLTHFRLVDNVSHKVRSYHFNEP